MSNLLKSLTQQFGQSVWLDYIHRRMLNDGELKRLVEQDGLGGMTSNPSIFEKAISGSSDYDAAISALLRNADLEPGDLFEKLAIQDIVKATDILATVYERTAGEDGFVSIEVSPYLAYDTNKTIEEARRLWKSVGRPNVMIKVPGTLEGLPAIKQLLSEGINVNITLLFAQQTYSQVAEAYISGLESLSKAGGDISKVASVASFFVSRIDTMADQQISARIASETDPSTIKKLDGLKGKTAIANAKMAYQIYLDLCKGERWKLLEATGARPQRLLWASTGTKNPAYPDTLYVDELIGKQTVNTMPRETLAAFADHGKLRQSLTEDPESAKRILEDLESLGISLSAITTQLTHDGVTLFADAADKLLSAVARKREVVLGDKINSMTYSLSAELGNSVTTLVEDWRKNWKVRRLWAKDNTLWTGGDESRWMDWLDISTVEQQRSHDFQSIRQWVKSENIKSAVLLGMGGSSLGAEVLRSTFHEARDNFEFYILDSTDPAAIKAVEDKIDYLNTLFVVSTKSGTTLEPNILMYYFFDRLKSKVGALGVGHRFMAITDPGSPMQVIAERDEFSRVLPGVPGIGGRYSVLSNFGMVPAAIMGIDVGQFLKSTNTMVRSCGASVPPSANPGVMLGAILGAAAKLGKDKVTIIASPSIADFGAWLEQLLAESTGKDGRGVIPVDGEPLGAPEVYGRDRVFIYIKDGNCRSPELDAKIYALEKASHPIIRIVVPHLMQLGQEFFRFEIATAVAGSIIGINPFNQPDVEASKLMTRRLTEEYEKTGLFQQQDPFFTADGMELSADPDNQQSLEKTVGADRSIAQFLKAHLNRVNPGDYVAILAYMQRCEETINNLQSMRRGIRDTKKVATCLGFGPRFLHSTGQAYKGGPNSGVFLQITCDDSFDLLVPHSQYTFGLVKSAQAEGDLQVLAYRHRRLLRVHLRKNLHDGLVALQKAMGKALQK